MQLHGHKKQRVLMNVFITSQFSYCPLVWMFQSMTLTIELAKFMKELEGLSTKIKHFSLLMTY